MARAARLPRRRATLARARPRPGTLDPAAIDEAALAAELSTDGLPDPDLLIRTSGEIRLSNFLLWQSAYAELMFVDTLWPDFDEQVFAEALARIRASASAGSEGDERPRTSHRDRLDPDRAGAARRGSGRDGRSPCSSRRHRDGRCFTNGRGW